MANRYSHKNKQEALESFEWLFREKLEQLDHLTRCLWADLADVGVREKDIPKVISEWFSELWREVAEEQEKQAMLNRRKGA